MMFDPNRQFYNPTRDALALTIHRTLNLNTKNMPAYATKDHEYYWRIAIPFLVDITDKIEG